MEFFLCLFLQLYMLRRAQHGGRPRGMRALHNFFNLYLVFVSYALFNHQFILKHAMHQFYLGNSLTMNSNVIPGAILHRSNGSVHHHSGYSMPQMFSSSCGLIWHSSTAMLLLHLSGDLELNLGPVERSQSKPEAYIHWDCNVQCAILL